MPAPRTAPEVTALRLGVDGSVGVGLIAYASVGLRTEWALSRKTFLLAGLAYMSGAPMEEGARFQAGVPTLGVRRYSGGVYAGLEAGVLAMRSDPYLPEFEEQIEPAKWSALPVVRGTLGTKLGPADLGISFSAPIATVSLSLGFDLATSSKPSRAKARKARTVVAERGPSSHR